MSAQLGKPIPEDLVPILAKDEEKQKAIREKAAADAVTGSARSIGPSTMGGSANGTPVLSAANTTQAAANAAQAKAPAKAAAASAAPAKPAPAGAVKKPLINMVIQKIPPFAARKQPDATAQSATDSAGPASPASEAAKLNVNAPTFRPGSTAVSPTGSGPSAAKGGPAVVAPAAIPDATSPKVKAAETAVATVNNPFFGVRPAKKAAPVHIKDDFNPFKFAKVADSANISA